MYGYLKWDRQKWKKDKLTNTYKCYYCGLCNAMKKNYGLFSLFFLNNDITLILIAISQCAGKCSTIPQCCLNEKSKNIDRKYTSEQWKHLAAMSIGMAYAKAWDDWLDEKDILSLLEFIIVKVLSSKAYREQKGLFSMLKKAMHNIKVAEDKGANLEEQGILTANMLSDAIQYEGMIQLDEAHQSYVSALAEWLCLVDAIDDYDKDARYGRYNPLLRMEYQIDKLQDEKNGLKQIFVSTYYVEIARVYRDIVSKMCQALIEMKICGNEQEILNIMTYEKMPIIFDGVLKKRF